MHSCHHTYEGLRPSDHFRAHKGRRCTDTGRRRWNRNVLRGFVANPTGETARDVDKQPQSSTFKAETDSRLDVLNCIGYFVPREH